MPPMKVLIVAVKRTAAPIAAARITADTASGLAITV